jgi:hypothetical protein
MKLDSAAVPNSDRIVASSVVANPGASLVVTNLSGAALSAGSTFALFSSPVAGSFASVTLPALPGSDLVWTNKLAVDGTIAVLSTEAVNPNPGTVSAFVADGKLTLSWPADRTGWTLQVQTNSLDIGLGSNWFDVPDSTTTNSVTLPIGSENGAVFYRMVYP